MGGWVGGRCGGSQGDHAMTRQEDQLAHASGASLSLPMMLLLLRSLAARVRSTTSYIIHQPHHVY